MAAQQIMGICANGTVFYSHHHIDRIDAHGPHLKETEMSKQQHHHHHHHHLSPSDIQNRAEADDSAIQLLAYQIHCDKGGFALDNWLEAERSLK